MVVVLGLLAGALAVPAASAAAPDPAASAALKGLQSAMGPKGSERDQQRAVQTVVDAVRGQGGLSTGGREWLREAAAPLLLELLGAAGNAPWARTDALMALRAIEADPAQVRQGIAIARADQSRASDLLTSRVEILEAWLVDREGRPQAARLEFAPADSEAERRGLAALAARGVELTESALIAAAMAGDVEVLEGFLDAGLDVDIAFRDVPGLLGYVAALGCSVETPLPQRLAALQLLVARGIDLERAGSDGSTPLMGAARHCPVAVVDRLLAAGALATAEDHNGRGALAVAFTHGRWDVAERLIEAGARLRPEQRRQLFIELPHDSERRSLIERALAPL